MSDTTYEEVRRCPRCEQPGEGVPGGRLPGAERGSSSIRFTCKNDRCRWLNTPWVVQVRADGTFPAALKKRTKMYPRLPNIGSEYQESLEVLQNMTLQPGAEIRR